VVAGAALFHKLTVKNYARLRVEIPLDFVFSVDFADLFEVRGFKRADQRPHPDHQVTGSLVTFLYRGRDQVRRFTRIIFESPPATLGTERASFRLTLKPDEQRELEVRIVSGCEEADAGSQTPIRFDDALAQRRSEIARLDAGWARISASHESFDLLLQRSAADLTSMIRFAPEGTFLMAGIPWFATLFGRDSILTALFALPFNPALAVGTLKTLASLQGSQVDHRRDEQPGKIVHEIRAGE
jgi:glycogen debranching enzyme